MAFVLGLIETKSHAEGFFLYAWVYEGTVGRGDTIRLAIVLAEEELDRDSAETKISSKITTIIPFSIEIEKILKVFEVDFIERGYSAAFKIEKSNVDIKILTDSLKSLDTHTNVDTRDTFAEKKLSKRIVCFDSENTADNYLQTLEGFEKDTK